MGKIKKLLETELVGGTNSMEIYPVTSTKAVYDSNNISLDKSLQQLNLSASAFNIINKYVSASRGNLVNGSNVVSTGFIYISDKIQFKAGMLDSRVATIAFYDKDFKHISSISNNPEYVGEDVTITEFPENTMYCRLTANIIAVPDYYVIVPTGLVLEYIHNVQESQKSIDIEGYNTYPYKNIEKRNNVNDAVVDISLLGPESTDSIGLYTFTYETNNQLCIRLCYLNSQGKIDSSRGDNGIAAFFLGEIVEGINVIKFQLVYDNVIEGKIVVDSSKLIKDGKNYGNLRVINSRTYVSITPYINTKEYYNYQPVANEIVWSNKTYFPTLDWMKNFIVSLKLYSVSKYDKTTPICISQVRVNNGGRTFITISKASSIDGNAPSDSASQICLYDNQSWNIPDEVNGHRYETLELKEKNSSGVLGTITVDWAVVPNTTDGMYRNYKVLDSLLSINVFSSKAPLNGANLVSFEIDGIPAKLQTSNLYNEEGSPDWLMLICHGNGQGDNLPLPTESKQWFLEHGISIATIRMQDQTGLDEYTTNATGWGNYICINRAIKLYNYLQENYNFKKSVIIAGASMGGCTLGALLYKKPFPIAFGLGVGAVPGVKIMFKNSSESYKKSIRAAYGMNADGSDDSNIADFVKGYDWYDMGLVGEQKIGYPNLYMYYGNDSTWRTNFQGETEYPKIVASLMGGGSFSIMKQAGTTDTDDHATDKIYTLAISDKVFEKELGIN